MIEGVLSISAAVCCLVLGISLLVAGSTLLFIDARVYLAMRRSIKGNEPRARHMVYDSMLTGIGIMIVAIGSAFAVAFARAL
jgi:hypothetical protein